MVRIVVSNPDQPPRQPRERKPASALTNPAATAEAPRRTPRNHGKLRFAGSDRPATREHRDRAAARPFDAAKRATLYALGRDWKARAVALALLRLPDLPGVTRVHKRQVAKRLLFLRYLRKRGRLDEGGAPSSFTFATTDGKTITVGLPLLDQPADLPAEQAEPPAQR
ncbi:MAG TPA: hypothetical protein VFL91_08275 [Thermomicrobiales bacterium]|nr:hypothetical protein [Thermomicrobiales bacterium]